MPTPRRSTRHDLPAPGARATPRRLDRNPDLDPDDLRRTGSTGIMLLTIASVLVGVGAGFLVFPKVFFGAKTPPPTVEKKDDGPGDAKQGMGEGDEGAVWRPDPQQLYPHANLLKAGSPPPLAPEPPQTPPAEAEDSPTPPATK